VQVVRHHALRNSSVAFEENLTDIQIFDVGAIVELGDRFIHRFDQGAHRRRLLAAGKDSQKEDLGFRQPPA
jgi:hypothetical protein